MAAFLTYLGQQYALRGTGVGSVGGVYNLATTLGLYAVGSTPALDGSGFTPVGVGAGYTPWTITGGDWTAGIAGGRYRLLLADRSVLASGLITGIAGAYLMDADDEALAWWPLAAPVTLQPGSVLHLDDMTIAGA